MNWSSENTGVLLLGYKDFITTETPTSRPMESVAKRTGKLTVGEDGTLTGTIRTEYSGHLATAFKLENYKESPNKREENLKDMVKARMSTAEITDISIQNFEDPEKPFIYEYKIKVPNYAQKTGRRLFLQPGFFEYGSQPVFSTADRKHPIFFHYPWTEHDEIEITLPKGFELENADAPQPLADASRVSSHEIKMSYNKPSGVLRFDRMFIFGNNGVTLFQPQAYTAVKGLFDAFHKSDSHMLTLRPMQ